jgi:hypothetical protein
MMTMRLQLLLFTVNIDRDVEAAAYRRLWLAVLAQALLDARAGDAAARDWAEAELGTFGCELELTPRVLAEMDPAELQRALGREPRRCWDCALLACDAARCRCGAGQWVRRGQAAEYAAITVRKNVRGKFVECWLWMDEDFGQ